LSGSPRERDFDDETGERLHDELLALSEPETAAWARERVDRVMTRFNAVRPDGRPLVAEILRSPVPNAFAAPGRYVYITRRLLERLPSDECAAFVLGHEVGHHDLGHLASFRGWTEWLPRNVAGAVGASLVQQLGHRLYGPEREADADRYAVALCVDAGYSGERCLQAFQILENEMLDRGGYDAVFGPEALLDPTDPDQGGVAYELQRWLWTRAHRYLPLRERRELAWAYLRTRGDGH
jgi:Zn-dependent protease with chaperone function